MMASTRRQAYRACTRGGAQVLWYSVCGLLSLFFVSAADAHAPGVVLSGTGTATIDGVANPGEWASAGCLAIAVNVPDGTTPGNLCAMNDEANLYLLVVFARSGVDPGNTAVFEFDNDHNGNMTVPGDDVLLINPDPSVGFRDEVRSTAPPCPPAALCGFFDTDLGGSNDGSGAFGSDGSFATYEFAHPLDSADDSNDFSLRRGDTVGFALFVRLITAAGDLVDTAFPAPCIACSNLYGDILITSRGILIDIKPGSDRNTINPRSRGKIPVAILSGPAFNAPLTIDPSSATFGRTGNEQSLAFCDSWPDDVNGDGLPDLVCHLNTSETRFLTTDSIGILKARTFNDELVVGTNAVTIVP